MKKQAVVVTIASGKGGVGKTTSAIHLALACVQQGLTVCIVDTDPSNAISAWLNDTEPRGIAHVLLNQVGNNGLLDVLHHNPVANVWVVPSGGAMLPIAIGRYDAPDLLRTIKGLVTALRSRFHIIIVDTPPGEDVLKGSIYATSDWVIIPTRLDQLGINGMNQELKFWQQMIEFGHKVRIAGILPTAYEQVREQNDMLAGLRRDLHGSDARVFTPITKSVRVQELARLHATMFDVDAVHPVAQQYTTLAREFIKMARITV